MNSQNEQTDAGDSLKKRPLIKIVLLWLLIAALAILPVLIYGPLTDSQKEFFGQRIVSEKAAPDFALKSHNGKEIKLSEFRGKIVLMCFGYTNCPDICPTNLTRLSSIYELLPKEEKARVQVLFVSVDPKRDTPEKLGMYVPFFNPAFLGATSSEERIQKMAKDYGASYSYVPQPNGTGMKYYTVTHSAYTYLIDPAGRLAVLYGFDQLSQPDKVASDIHKILVKSGRGAK